MSQNQEIIEAKLCAYIDGELDAEGRVEIERHLEANPQHRRLLESLRATRDLIKWLPREAAPSEVAETLNGQLERSVLLDDAAETLGPSIWPRVFAAAAIVLLTAGLFAAVYFTLPKSQKVAIPYAREGAAPSAEPSAGEPGRSPAMAENTESGSIAMKGGMAGKAAAGADQKDSVDIKKPELDRLASEVNQNRAAIVAAANGLNAAPGAAGGNAAPALATNAVVVLVRSNSPSDTRKQLTSYLDAQKIDWKQTEPEGQLNASPQAQQQAVQQQSIAAERSNERESGRLATTQRGQSEVATIAPSPQLLRQQENLARSVTTQSSGYAINGWTLTTVDSTGEMYVARMSRQQAVQLSNSISQEGSQTVELKDLENSGQAALPAAVPSQLDAASRRDSGAFGAIQPTTRPTEQALAKEAPPATQPAAAEAAPDQPLDVVIVVQSSAPATQPATQPAGALPTTSPINSDAPQTQPAQSGPNESGTR